MRGETTVAMVAVLVLAAALPVHAQEPPAAEPIQVTTSFGSTWVSPDEALVFTLSRPLPPDEGRLAVVIADVDVTPMLSTAGQRATYRPRGVPLPFGESAVIVYVVSPGGSWQDVARVSLRVLSPGGFEKADFVPRLTLNNKGQLAEGHTAGATGSARPEFQDFGMNLGVQTLLARDGIEVRTQSNIMGVSRRQEALRFGELREAAPRVDLADYVVSFDGGPASARVGHVTFGNQRHLLAGHAARGATAGWRAGSFARLDVAGMNGGAIVGWSNLLGLNRSTHRVLGASLGLELVPGRPGVLQIDASAVQGANEPRAGFTQGLVHDVERSRGGALRLAASLPSQRARVEAGYASTRFENPPDPSLAQGEAIVPVLPSTRDAHYVDAQATLLQSALSRAVPVNLAVAYRHERVDPLYRAVGLTSVRADILQNTVEVTASVGQAGLRFSHARSRDNLDRLAAVLASHTRANTAGIDVPVAMFLGARAPGWVPVLTTTLMRMHQFGEGIPEGFAETHVPDQVSTNASVGVQSSGRIWRLGLRHDRSLQDNRQPTREEADFATRTFGLTLGVTPLRALDLAADASTEHADNRERDEQNDTRRIGGVASWRPFGGTTLAAAYALTRRTDEPRTAEQRATDLRLELSQRISFFGRRSGRTSGQFFMRYSRLGMTQVAGDEERSSLHNWTVAMGATLNVF